MKRTSSAFVPDTWSQKFLSKFYDEMVLPVRQARSFLMKELTKLINDWSKMGLTPEQIAEKIDPEMFEPQLRFGRIGYKFYNSPIYKENMHKETHGLDNKVKVKRR